MKQFLQTISEEYLNPKLDFRVQLFFVLAMAGFLINAVTAISALLIGSGLWLAIVNAITAVSCVAIGVYAKRTGRYNTCYKITVVVIFFISFTFMFFTGGGYRSAMPSFFISAVVFTAFMIKGRSVIILSVAELSYYAGLCVLDYQYPALIPPLSSQATMLFDMIIGFVSVAIMLSVTVFIHFRIYDKQQEQLAERNAELDRINHNKTMFLSNVSHELKTPLTVVSSHIQMARLQLEKQPGTEDLQHTMLLVSGEAERMALMVSQLLDVSRIDESRMLMELKQESIIEIIQTTLDTYYPAFSKNHNQLTFRRIGDIPPVLSDHARVMQVLVNLISNATRHTRDGVITVSAGMENETAVITVSDTGEGIAAERIPHLFDRYYSHRPEKGAKARTGVDAGTGLGLFICKYIIEAHGGHIWIESEVGRGTHVHFTLPLDG